MLDMHFREGKSPWGLMRAQLDLRACLPMKQNDDHAIHEARVKMS